MLQEGKAGCSLQEANGFEHVSPDVTLVVEDLTVDAPQDDNLLTGVEDTQSVLGELDVEHSDSDTASCSTASEQLTGTAEESSLGLRLVRHPLQHYTSTCERAPTIAVHVGAQARCVLSVFSIKAFWVCHTGVGIDA